MECQKKYELTEETIECCGRTLHRIRALRDFGNVKAGELGGFVESENNLSHEGKVWVYGSARVYGNARVSGSAMVCGNARVYGIAEVSGSAEVYDNAEVYGSAEVCGNARLYGHAWVSGNTKVSEGAKVHDFAVVSGDARVSGNAKVYDFAVVSGNAKVRGGAEVCCNAEVTSARHYLCIGPIGSRNETITFFRTENNGISVQCGCFSGTIEEFLEQETETHGDNEYAVAYHTAAELAKACIKLESVVA